MPCLSPHIPRACLGDRALCRMLLGKAPTSVGALVTKSSQCLNRSD